LASGAKIDPNDEGFGQGIEQYIVYICKCGVSNTSSRREEGEDRITMQIPNMLPVHLACSKCASQKTQLRHIALSKMRESVVFHALRFGDEQEEEENNKKVY
jgi:hypothetical protein